VTVAGCPELVAATPEEYVNIAVRLSEQPERLDYYRANLRTLSRESGLVDAKRFAGNLAAAFTEMMNNLHRKH
jgi:predicted O-linked N-acetylglucosamine transferase (SPINDLY family)